MIQKNSLKTFINSNVFKKIVLLFLVTRIVLLIVGIWARETNPNPTRLFEVDGEYRNYPGITTIFHGWDSNWYLDIASRGYQSVQLDVRNPVKTSHAFFPLYPIMMKIVGTFVGGYAWGGLIVSNICFLFSGIFLYLLVAGKYGENAAFKATKFLFIFPISFIFAGIQSESIFLMLFVMLFWFLSEDKPLEAGVVGFFAALTKPIGFLAFIPILYFCFIQKKFKILPVLMPILGLLTYFLYLYKITGNFNAFFLAEHGWEKSLSLDIYGIYQLFREAIGNGLIIINLIIAVVILLLAFVGAYIMGLDYVVVTICFVAAYILTSSKIGHLFSFPRYFSILFPAYISLAKMGELSKLFDCAATVFLCLIQVYLFFFWTQGAPIPI